MEVGGSPECTKYCACASPIAQRTLNAQLAKTSKMNEAVRLCMKIAHGRRRVGSGWQPKVHKALRLCIQNSPGQVKCTVSKSTQKQKTSRLCMQNDPRSALGWIGAAAQNAPSTAPVQQKYSEAWKIIGWQMGFEGGEGVY